MPSFNISPTFTGPVSFGAVLKNASNPGGILVSALFTSSFSDVNGNSFAGIAISSDTSVSATDGNWQYSLDGTTWVDINKPPSNKVPLIDQALLLSSSTYLRFVPALNFGGTPGSLTVFAVDNSSSTTFSTAINQRYFDTTGDDHRAIDANQSRVSASGVLLTATINNAPTVSEALVSNVLEGATAYNLNLLLHASDVDAGDTLTVGSVTYSINGTPTGSGGTDLPSGLTRVGALFTVDPTDVAFNHLAAGEHTTILASYIISDGHGGSVAQTETITINGTNDLPTVSAAESSTASEGDSPYSLNMLLHASDPDTSDMLTVGSVTYTVDGTPTGNGGDDFPVGVTRTGGILTVDPTNPAFNHLAIGESAIIIASYTITDGHGGSVHQSATVTINGTNDAPTVSGAGSSSASLGSAAYNLNLFLLASDPEGDPLTVSNVTYTVDGTPTGNGGNDLPSGVTLTGSTLRVDPDNAAYDYVVDGGHVTIVASYTISDGHGGSALQTETVTLNRTMDFPLISQPESSTVSEGDISTDLNLLLHSSDPDDDDLTVENVIFTVDGVVTGHGGSDLPSGVTLTGSTLALDPTHAVFDYLAVGECTTILLNYSVIDHAGGSVAQTETITINGTNDPPTVLNAESSTASEGDSPYSLNMLLHATDPDTSDMLTVGSVTYTVGGTPTGNGGDDLPVGVTLTGGTLTVDPTNPAFNHLAVGESAIIIASYTIADGHGGSVHQSATVMINGTNDAPSVSGAGSSSVSLGSAAYNQNLLLLASDPEGDPLTIINVTYTVDGIPTGNGGNDLPSGVTLTGSTLRVDPDNAAYDYVVDGGHVTIVASYTIFDGHGGSVLQTETVTLNRTTDFPLISQSESSTVSEGDISMDLNLLLHASDPDDDDLTVENVIFTVDGVATGNGGGDLPSGVTLTGSTLALDPTHAAFDYLAVGECTTILLNYSVIDHAGGSVAQTETITINGTNDPPTVLNAESSTASEGDSPYSLNMLLHATDPDTSDTLTVGSVTYTVGGTPTGNGGDDLPVGVTLTGGTLTVDPTNPAFNHLAVGESAIIIASYTIADGHGGSVHQSATVMINGTNDAPSVSGAGSSSVSLGSAAYNQNLLLLASDPEGDPLTIINVTYTVDGIPTGNGGSDLPSGVTLTGSTLSINPDNAAYDYVLDGGHVTIVASYTIVDGHGGSVLQTETVRLNRATDFPLISQQESSTVSEGDIPTDLNLLLHASDPDDDDLSVESVIYTVDSVATGNGGSDLPFGVTRSGSLLRIYPSSVAFNHLAVGEYSTILASYSVADNAGGSVAQTETITINGTNDLPTVSAAESSTASEGEASYNLNLLLHATDPDTSDTLTVGSVTYTVDGTPTGNGGDDLPQGVIRRGSTLTVDPNDPAFNHLAVGENITILVSFTIADSHGGSVHQSATVTINGTNDAPMVSGAKSSSVSLGSAAYNQNLLLLASDPEGDPLTVSNVTYTVDGTPTGDVGHDLPSGITLTGSTLRVDPNNAAYDYVLDGGHVTIVASYTISDGHGGSVLQTETVTLNRTTDFPLISQQESSTVSEGDIPTDLNLLLHSSDPDDDDLTVENVIYTVDGVATGNGGSNRPSGVMLTGSTLTLDPTHAIFDYLAVGEHITILVDYSVIDHAGGSVAQTETITINGTNDAPTVLNAESSTVSEGEASYNMNLLLHASDPDTSDTLTVGSVTYTVDGTPTGNGGDDLPQGVIRRGSTLTVDPHDPAFNHLAVGESAIIIASYTIADGNGGSVDQTATVTINGSSETNEADVTPPTVIAFSPENGATGVAINNNIVLTFSEAVLRGTGTIAIHSGSSEGAVMESYDAATSTNLTLSGTTLTINPTNSLVHGTHYSITFANGSINDYAGNQFGGTTSYDFTTGADPFAAIHGDDDETTELILGGVGALGFLAWLVF